MTVSRSIVDRLRANLAAAGIPLSGADLDALVAGPFLEGVASFDARQDETGDRALPDHLAASAPLATPLEGAPRDGSAAAAPNPVPGESLQDVASRIRRGELSPVELTRRALDRIAERDPALNAFQLVLDDRAMRAARRAESEIARGSYRGPLHGVPIAVKDLLDLEGTPTTAGSKILADRAARDNATAATRLEEAGAVIVGKTRMSEFAYLPGSANAHYGPTRNPRAPERDAGGSSGGSAAAVADGMVFAALGTDTGGSIRIPAALCGVVGLKATFGRVSLHGVVPLSWSLDHLGPITRTVGDAAILLGALAGPDPRDPRTLGAPTAAVSPGRTGHGLRVGVLRSAPALATEAAWRAVRAAATALEAAGMEVVEVDLPELADLWAANNVVLAVEAAAFHQPWLRTRLDAYGEIPRQRLLAAHAHGPTAYVRAQRLRHAARESLLGRVERIDLLALPTQPDGAPPLGSWGPTLLTGPFNALGWPALTLPAGATPDGRPLGVQLVARPWEEELVLRAGMLAEGQGLGTRD